MKTKKQHKGRRTLQNMTDTMKQKYAELFITALDTMEKGEYKTPWVMPGNTKPMNFYSKKPYRGFNAFLLNLLGSLKGFQTGCYMTMKQIENKEGHYKYDGLSLDGKLQMDENGMPMFNDKGLPVMVYPGAFPVYFFKPLFKDADGNKLTDAQIRELSEEEREELQMYATHLQTYYVWNIDQTTFKTKYPEDYEKLMAIPKHDYEHGVTDEVLERIIMQGEWRCPIEFGGSESSYSPSKDLIRLPERSRFLSDELFYATAIHEMAHSTAKECGRSEDGRFGSEAYAMEEFVAELTSACICSMVGVGKLLDEQHLAYVDNWRNALRSDKDFVPKVIDQVQRATNYIIRLYNEVSKKAHGPLLLEAA